MNEKRLLVSDSFGMTQGHESFCVYGHVKVHSSQQLSFIVSFALLTSQISNILNVKNLSVVWWFSNMGQKGEGRKKEQRSQKREVDTWMSPEAGDEIKRKRGWVEGWALSLSCSPYGHLCVCMLHMCVSAGGVEQGVCQMDTQTHKWQIPPTSVM